MTVHNADEIWEELENASPRQQLIRRLYATEQHARIIQKDSEQPLTVLLRDVRQYLEAAEARVAELEMALAERALPATGPYVDRLIRIFRDRPAGDASAVVLQDYARAALAATKEPKP
jgi:hypothetical protein